MLAEIEAAAQAKGAGVGSEDWTWSAQDFSSWYLQVISMDINKLTALAVLNGQHAGSCNGGGGGGCGRGAMRLNSSLAQTHNSALPIIWTPTTHRSPR